jgi:lysozyme
MQNKDNSIFGIDISHHNTVTNWNSIKSAGVKFIYCKATEGVSYVDPTFDSYVKNAKAIGIPVGAYHFAHPDNDPIDEANHFRSVIDNYSLDLIPVLDLEVPSSNGANLVEWTRTFIAHIQQRTMLYTGNWFISQEGINGLSDIPLWNSYYKDTPPPNIGGWDRWAVWQYIDKGVVSGISGDVDLNACIAIDVIQKPKWVDIERIVTVGLNMRQQPETGFDVLAVIPKGTKIHISKLTDSWAYTEYGNGGWVYRQYLATP